MQLLVEPNGPLRCVYSEEINLGEIGQLTIRRASRVEPDPQGGWTADLSPVGGPNLGPFEHRSSALAAELAWLEDHWLTPSAESA